MDDQIKSFRADARAAGDRIACAVCDLALYDAVNESLMLDEQEAHKLESLRLDASCDAEGRSVVRQAAARALVATWIAYAGAQS